MTIIKNKEKIILLLLFVAILYGVGGSSFYAKAIELKIDNQTCNPVCIDNQKVCNMDICGKNDSTVILKGSKLALNCHSLQVSKTNTSYFCMLEKPVDLSING